MTYGSERLTSFEAAAAFRSLRAAGIATDPAVVVHDLTRVTQRIRRLADAFPPHTLHAVAIKANPVVAILRSVVEAGGGLEAASWEEVELALAAGCAPGRILYDSPAKTVGEIDSALRIGVTMNADSFDELVRIDERLPLSGSERAALGTASELTQRSVVEARFLGLRINPQVGQGNIAHTSVATPRSRFGVPVDDTDRIIDAFRRYPWLTALHVHVGSQGCVQSLLVAAASRVDRLRRKIDGALGEGRVRVIDLGGGLPVPYDSAGEREAFSLEAYIAALRTEVPGLFRDGLALATEFGRWIHASAGFAVSRVEAVKRSPLSVASLHVGADLFMRRAYRPEEWHHDFVVLDGQGVEKLGAPMPWTLAGPLCFGGDVLARDLPLPPIEAGDHVLIRDAGAYTLALWSRHCSRARPLVAGITERGPVVLLERESLQDIVAFWGGRSASERESS